MKINTKKNQKYGESCVAIGARFLPLAFETFGRTSDEIMKLLRNLVGMGSEATLKLNRSPFLVSYPIGKED